VAVVCAGSDNTFGHPSSEVLERLIDRLGEDKIYLTGQDGTIEFITDGETLWVETDNQDMYHLVCKSMTTRSLPQQRTAQGDNQTVNIAHHGDCDEALP
jgi:hypothetical protein